MNPPKNATHCAIPDAGTTGNCIMCDAPFLNKKQISNVPTVLLPDYSTMKATESSIINIMSLPAKAKYLAHSLL